VAHYKSVKRASVLGVAVGAIALVWVLVAVINPAQGLMTLAKFFAFLGLLVNVQGTLTLAGYGLDVRFQRQREVLAANLIGLAFSGTALALLLAQ
jgi:hypothetical protein